MLVYGISVFISTFFAWLYQMARTVTPSNTGSRITKRLAGMFLFVSFLVLFVLSAFRVDVGLDYPSYTRLFNDIYTYGFTNFEPGFRLMINAIQIFTTDPQWLFIISSLITVGGIFISIKKYSVNPAMSVFLFCTMGFLSHSFNLTRQFIAVAIILYSLSFIVNKQFIKYAITVGVAALFHQTAIIMLPIYFVLRMKIAPVYYLITILIAGMLTVFQGFIINNLVLNFYPQYYDEGFIGETIVSPYYIIICTGLALSVLYLLNKKRISMEDNETRVMVNAIFLIILAHIFFAWVPLSNRVSLYLDIMLILFVPKLLSYVRTKIYRRLALAIIGVYFTYAAYSSLLDNANGVLPYKSSLISASIPDEGGRAIS